jgi:hypothetical protein
MNPRFDKLTLEWSVGLAVIDFGLCGSIDPSQRTTQRYLEEPQVSVVRIVVDIGGMSAKQWWLRVTDIAKLRHDPGETSFCGSLWTHAWMCECAGAGAFGEAGPMCVRIP